MQLTEAQSAPSATALEISEPRRTPPSMARRIFPFATSAHSRRISTIAGTVYNCLPPWLEIITPSTPCCIPKETSSGVVTVYFSKHQRSRFENSPPFTQTSIFVWLCRYSIEFSKVAAVSEYWWDSAYLKVMFKREYQRKGRGYHPPDLDSEGDLVRSVHHLSKFVNYHRNWSLNSKLTSNWSILLMT